MEKNDSLYHYTNVDVLALILKNRTIRFNSLDKMDDLQEKETADLKNIAQFFYVSCWTEEKYENIPMWKMYTTDTLGVRIKLKKNPFKLYDNYATDVQNVINYPVKEIKDDTNGKPFSKSLIPVSEMFKRRFLSMFPKDNKILYKIEYTQERDKLYPKVNNSQNEKIILSFDKLGKYKNKFWEFQNEWRYLFPILPINVNQPVEKILLDFCEISNRIRLDNSKQIFPYYDLKIDDLAFEQMEILLNPRISTGNRAIVKDLVEKYNPEAMVEDSELLGKI